MYVCMEWCKVFFGVGGGHRLLAPLLLLGYQPFMIILFLSTTLLTRTTGAFPAKKSFLYLMIRSKSSG
jgi:hypothetical protein